MAVPAADLNGPGDKYPVRAAGMLVLLILAWYFLGRSAASNNQPTYYLALIMVAWPALRTAAQQILQRSTVAATAAVLLGYLVISGLWSQGSGIWPMLSLLGDATLVTAFLLGTALAMVRWRGFADWLLVLYVSAAVVSAAYSVHLHYLLPDYQPLPEKERLVAMGRLANPVIASLSYGLAIAFICQRLLFRPWPFAIGWALLAIPLGWAILLAQTRGVLLGLGIAAFAGLMERTRQPTHRTLAASAALAGTAMATLFVVYPLMPVLLDWALPRATSLRPEIWEASLAAVSDGHLWFGLGQLDPAVLTHGHLTFAHPHSLLLSMLYFGGLVGLALLITLLALAVRVLLRAEAGKQRTLAMISLTFGLCVLLVDGDRLLAKITFMWLLFWLPMAQIIAIELTADQSHQSASPSL